MGEPVASLDEYLLRMREWITADEMLMDEFEIFLWEFGELGEFREKLLLDAFIFDYKLPESSLTPFQYFLQKAELRPEERRAYEGLSSNFHSFFEILEVRRDEGLRLRDLRDQKEYWVREKKGTHQAMVGEVVWCRIVSYGGEFFVLGPGMLTWSPEGKYTIQRALRHMGPISAFDVIRTHPEKGTDRKRRELWEVKEKLKRKLNRLGIKLDFRDLPRRIERHKSPMEAFPEIFNFNFPSMLDFEETLELVRELWNNFPRREFGGRPPRHFEPGPMEKTLYHTLLSEAQANIDPDDYPSPEAAQKAVDEFCRKWLRTPQEELAGKTPEGVILEEREARGDQRKSIDIRITVSSIPDFDANKAERLYREGLEAFKRGDWIKAVECFDEVTEMYPEQYKAWGNLGSSLANLGLKEAAIMCLERALEIKPDYQVAKENLAHVKEMSEEKCEALTALAVVERLTRTLKGRKTKDENR